MATVDSMLFLHKQTPQMKIEVQEVHSSYVEGVVFTVVGMGANGSLSYVGYTVHCTLYLNQMKAEECTLIF